MASVDRKGGVRTSIHLAAVGVHSRWRGRGRVSLRIYASTCSEAQCKKKEARERKGRKRRGRVSPSCSGRGHGTNAAPVSVLVSRTPHPLVPAIPRVPRHRGTPHLAARYNAIVGIVVRGGRSQFRPRPVPLPVYQPGALVKCFSSRIMTRSARL